MGYIRFVLSMPVSAMSLSIRLMTAFVAPPSSPVTRLLKTNLIMHALAARGGKVIEIVDFILDSSRLDDNDILG